jgi:serine/threonine protein kinase
MFVVRLAILSSYSVQPRPVRRISTLVDLGHDLVGLELSEGRYRILSRLGEGSMGQVYVAHDAHLQTDVVIKFPARSDTILDESHLLQRFEREVRSLVRLSHPHIVKIIDVGNISGSPYVVLQYLSGGTLKDRLESGPDGEPRPLPIHSLRDWLMDVAKALDFIHFQGHIHRDVKPANIFFDSHDNAFLGDFGIIKALKTDVVDNWRHNSLTAPGFLLGTPSYVAPEIVMGYAGDGSSDQYSLALTVYEVLTGCNIMAGASPSATLVNQTTVDPPALDSLVPDIPPSLAQAVRHGLSKDPENRYPTCVAFAQEALSQVPIASAATAAETGSHQMPGLLPCPTCRGPIVLSSGQAGQQVRCDRCQAVSVVRNTAGGTQLSPITDPTPTLPPKPVGPWTSGSGQSHHVAEAADSPPERSRSFHSLSGDQSAGERKRRLIMVRTAVFDLLALLLTGAAWLSLKGPWLRGTLPSIPRHDVNKPLFDRDDPAATTDNPSQSVPLAQADDKPVTISIVYGTEKDKWFKEATQLFEETSAGHRCRIKLRGLGSKEGAEAILAGPGPNNPPIHVWSPASSAYRDVFERNWRFDYSDDE